MTVPTTRTATIGPEFDATKYRIIRELDAPAAGLETVLAAIETGGLRHEVIIWTAESERWDTDSWLDAVSVQTAIDHYGFVPVRESFFCHVDGKPAAAVVTNATSGESLEQWIAKRPDRDPIGALSILIPIAGALDRFHEEQQDGPERFEPLRLKDVIVRDDQLALIARPPWPNPLGDIDPLHDLDSSAPERSVTGEPSGADPVAADAYALGRLATLISSTRERASGESDSSATSLASFPVLQENLDRAMSTTPSERPSSLVPWLADLRGATISSAEADGVALWRVPLDSSDGDRGARRLPLLLSVGMVAIGLAAFLVGRATNPGDSASVVSVAGSTTTDGVPAEVAASADPVSTATTPAPTAAPSTCDPSDQRADAERFVSTMGRGFDWIDQDNDCLADAYEVHWIGSDYLTFDESAGPPPDAESQIRVLVAMREDGAFSTEYNLTKCEPNLFADIAKRYVEATSTEITWIDRDQDCVLDAYEINGIGTDPTTPDTDGNGIGDGIEPSLGSGGLLASAPYQLRAVVDFHGMAHIDRDAVNPTDPVACDPAEWRAAARAYIDDTSSEATWVDPDGDCLHSGYEEAVKKTDPENRDSDGDGEFDGVDADVSDLMIEPIDSQLRYASAGSTDQ